MAMKLEKFENLTELQRTILLLLNANSLEAVKGRLWLQKEIFLIANNIKSLREECEYKPNYWGPYSDVLAGELDELASLGLAEYYGNRLVLTPSGAEVAAGIEVSPEKKLLIEDMKSLLNDLTKDELLAFVYFAFPEYAEEGAEKNRITRRRSVLVQALYRKGKISLGRAAELENVPLSKIIQKHRSLAH